MASTSKTRTSASEPDDVSHLHVDQKILIPLGGGNSAPGTIRFIGTTKFAAGVWVGVELETPSGKNNGTVMDVTYFQCPDKYGIMMRPGQIKTLETPLSKAGSAKPKAPEPTLPKAGEPTTPKAGETTTPKAGTPKSKTAAGSSATPSKRRSTSEGKAVAARPSVAADSEPSLAAGPATSLQMPGASAGSPPELASPIVAVAAADSPPEESGALQSVVARKSLARSTTVPKPVPSEMQSRMIAQLEAFAVQKDELRQRINAIRGDIVKMKDIKARQLEHFEKFELDASTIELQLEELILSEEASMKESASLQNEISELRKNGRNSELQVSIHKHSDTRELVAVEMPKTGISDDDGDGVQDYKGQGDIKGETIDDEEGKRALRKILALRGQIQLERSKVAFAELEVEELELQVEEAQDEINQAMHPDFFVEAMLVAWHKEALTRYIRDHQHHMRRLRRREAELDRAKREAAEADRELDIEAMKKILETTKSLLEHDEQNREVAEIVVHEREENYRHGEELHEAAAVLEAELLNDISVDAWRSRELCSVVEMLVRARVDLKQRCDEAEADLARMELRMSAVKSQKDSSVGGHMASCDRVVTAKALAAARGSVVQACGWAFCIAPNLRDEAELGSSFATLNALHRMWYKSRLLASTTHKHYIEDARLPILQSNAPMEWLCTACLSACIIAYSLTGVLGRLQALDPERYKKVIRGPALKSCAGNEKVLDAALDLLVVVLMDNLSARGLPKDVNKKLKALGAQLCSLEKSEFQDEPFASWESIGCAIEACRAACAATLYVSHDAGGKRRQMWQDLYNKADTLRNRVGKLSAESGRDCTYEMEENMLAPKAKEIAQGSVGAEALAEDAGGTLLLDQTVLDLLFVQVKMLDTHCQREPADDHQIAELDKAFQVADAQLQNISKATRAAEKASKTCGTSVAPALIAKPWVALREGWAGSLLAASQSARRELDLAVKECHDAEEEIDRVVGEIEATKKAISIEEDGFGRFRVSAELSNVVEDQVAELVKQIESHNEDRSTLDEELQKEDDQLKIIKKDTEAVKRKMLELELHLNTVRTRISKRFNTGVTAEEVAVLRQANADQRDHILRTKRSLNHLVPDPVVDSIQDIEDGPADCVKIIMEKGKERMDAKASWRVEACDNVPKAVPAKALKLEEFLGSLEGRIGLLYERVRKAQVALLREQASASIVKLGSQHSMEPIHLQSMRLQEQAHESENLKDAVTGLELKRSGVADIGSVYGSVAYSRFLRSLDHSSKMGAAVKVTLPLSKEASSGGLTYAYADLGQFSALHRMIV